MSDALTLAQKVLDDAGELILRRELTPHEKKNGDILRVAKDFDHAENAVYKAAHPVVEMMRRQLLAECDLLLKQARAHGHKDASDIAGVSSSYVEELAQALETAAIEQVQVGRRQILDLAHKRNRLAETRLLGMQLAGNGVVPLLTGKAKLLATSLAERAQAQARMDAAASLARGLDDVPEDVVSASTDSLMNAVASVAASIARDAVNTGRQQALGEVKDQITELVRSAVLDNSTCDVCAAADGDTVSDTDPDAAGKIEDGLASVPDPDCEGVAYGNSCRCLLIAGFG